MHLFNFTFLNVATRKFKIAYGAYSIFLLDSTATDNKKSRFLGRSNIIQSLFQKNNPDSSGENELEEVRGQESDARFLVRGIEETGKSLEIQIPGLCYQ